MASLESISITVGKQITVEQLIKLSIVMRISRYDHVYRHHVRDKYTETILHLLLLLHTSTAIQHASRVLSSWKQSNALSKMTWCGGINSCNMINTPSCYPRWQQYNTCLAAPTITGKGHRKIEPKAKHFSHCKKYQSSRLNQTDNSKRLAKITNHT